MRRSVTTRQTFSRLPSFLGACLVLFMAGGAFANEVIEDAPATVEAPADPDDAEEPAPTDRPVLDPQDALGPGLSPFLYGSLGLLATEIVGLSVFLGGSVIFVATAALALGGGGVIPILGFLGAYVGLLSGLCGFGTTSALGSAGAAAAAAEATDRSGLPFFLGSLPGVAVGIIGGLIAGISFIAIGPTGYLTQGLALFAGSPEGLPVELLVGFALQAAAGPIALAGAFGAAMTFGTAFDEVVAEESVNLKATPAVARRMPLLPQRAPSIRLSPMRF